MEKFRFLKKEEEKFHKKWRTFPSKQVMDRKTGVKRDSYSLSDYAQMTKKIIIDRNKSKFKKWNGDSFQKAQLL